MKIRSDYLDSWKAQLKTIKFRHWIRVISKSLWKQFQVTLQKFKNLTDLYNFIQKGLPHQCRHSMKIIAVVKSKALNLFSKLIWSQKIFLIPSLDIHFKIGKKTLWSVDLSNSTKKLWIMKKSLFKNHQIFR